jgi:hypothetical protein
VTGKLRENVKKRSGPISHEVGELEIENKASVTKRTGNEANYFTYCFYISSPKQGCQMVCFRTKNPNLGKLWRVLQWKMLICLMDTWSI